MNTTNQSHDNGITMPNIKQQLKSYNKKSMRADKNSHIDQIKHLYTRDFNNTKSSIAFHQNRAGKSSNKFEGKKDKQSDKSKALPMIKSSSQPRLASPPDSNEVKMVEPTGFRRTNNASALK